MTGVRIGHPRAHAEAVVRLAGEIQAGTRPLSASHAGVASQFQLRMRLTPKWGLVLSKYQLPNFHMTDAMSLQKTFSKDNGWDRERIQRLVWEL